MIARVVLSVLILAHLGTLLGVAGALKAADTHAFSAELVRHALLPSWSVSSVAKAIPATELGLVMWIASGRDYRQAALATAILFVVFLIYRGALYAFGPLDAECGCHGSTSHGSHGPLAESVALVINAGLAMTVFALGPARQALYPADVAAAVGVVAVPALVILFAIQRRRLHTDRRNRALFEQALDQPSSSS